MICEDCGWRKGKYAIRDDDKPYSSTIMCVVLILSASTVFLSLMARR